MWLRRLVVGVNVAVVVVGSEVVEAGVGVGEQVPDDHQDGAADRDDRLLLPSSTDEASVAGAEEGVGRPLRPRPRPESGRGRGSRVRLSRCLWSCRPRS